MPRSLSLHESLSKVQGRDSLIFRTHVAFSIDFPNIYNDYLFASVIDLFLYVVILVNEGDFFHPAPGVTKTKTLEN